MGNKTETFVTIEQFETLVTKINELERKVTEVTKPVQKSQKDMTDTDAYEILTGRYKELTHNKAAQTLQLSYGQIYSCRLGFTFRHIHTKLQSEGFINPWIKK